MAPQAYRVSMGTMASWTDGPEYAPLARPEVFVAPDAAPLPTEPPPPASPSEPDLRPTPGFTADAAGVALASLAPPAPPKRDPREPFDVASTPVTSWAPPTSFDAAPPDGVPPGAVPPSALPPGVVPPGVLPPGAPVDGPPPGLPHAPTPSAWGAAHASTTGPHPGAVRTPHQPFPAAAPQPTQHLPGPSSTWLPPHAPAPWEPPPGPPALRPVTLADMARAVTPGVLICLVVGGLVPVLALPLYVVASVLAQRIDHRRERIARAFSIGVFLILAAGLVSTLLAYGSWDPFRWYDAILGWAGLACWVMVAFTLLTVGDALRRGERPDPR